MVWGKDFQTSFSPLRERVYLRYDINLTSKAPRASPFPALVQHLLWRITMRKKTLKRASQLPPALFVTVGCVWIVLALVGTSREVTAQAKATIVSIEGATTTDQSIDGDAKPVTVRVPSQSAADIRGKDAQGNVTATV